ncbi:hypothetical protein [Hymenobacter persicinus]|uniref:Lipocalin-like domain-containing protein n=1 Tax=Hymenobacter persicinus TaxID=2025506 RepID=A0A4Q5L7Q3_9BACT|nr:hypothetical protein [Hymenobacter persicinus]RYU77205.1 hypothetical protein EWM57_17710 [Hymenobacter persicinus]
MKKMSVLLGLAAAASLSLASCQKELEQVKPADQANAAATQGQSKSELLSASPWRLTDMTTTTAASAASKETATVSLLARLKPAVRDNVFTYAAGGEYSINEGGLKVRPEAPQLLTGTWKLSEQGDSLTITRENTVRRFAVAELTATTLRLNRTEAGANGAAPTTYSSVYSH